MRARVIALAVVRKSCSGQSERNAAVPAQSSLLLLSFLFFFRPILSSFLFIFQHCHGTLLLCESGGRA